ncbi:MAG: galactokinase [Dehalococcoidia bacterium]|nr:galactokinase [Dehalococcoidia bacterium]
MRLRNEIVRLFHERYGAAPQFVAFAPGRVNLIGEHTDYNDGFVLPIAIQLGVYAAGSLTGDGTVEAISQQFPGEIARFPVGSEPEGGGWQRYLGAVLAELAEVGVRPAGLRLLVAGDIPLEVGLSSSAAFSVCTAMLVSALSGRAWDDRVALARLCQRAENRTGVMCGLMDQMASLLCTAGRAMFLDCRDLRYEMVPLGADLAVLVGNTGVKRALANGRYNRRREECEQAAGICGVPSLRDLTPAGLESCRQSLGDLLYRRARHVVDENERVRLFVEALKANDAPRAGELMSESHASLRDDYEVSCAELDAMVEAFMQAGALGARMVGAGFGGSAIALAPATDAAAYVPAAARLYRDSTGIDGDFYAITAGDGAWCRPGRGRS